MKTFVRIMDWFTWRRIIILWCASLLIVAIAIAVGE